MTIILITVGATLLGIFIVASLIYLLVLMGKLKKSSQDNAKGIDLMRRDLETYYAQLDRADEEIRDDISKRSDDCYREIDKQFTAVNQNLGEVQRSCDSRFDQLLNRIEKEYVRKDQTLLATNK